MIALPERGSDGSRHDKGMSVAKDTTVSALEDTWVSPVDAIMSSGAGEEGACNLQGPGWAFEAGPPVGCP